MKYILFSLITVCLSCDTITYPAPVCKTVEQLLWAEHRTVVVLFTDNTRAAINQPRSRIMAGSKYCFCNKNVNVD